MYMGYDGSNRLSTINDISSQKTLTLNYNPTTDLLESISGPVTEAVPDGIWVS